MSQFCQREDSLGSHCTTVCCEHDDWWSRCVSTQTVFAYCIHARDTEVLIQLDTGSSDLWVSPETSDIEFTNSTDLQADEAYGIGHISGSVQFANVQLGNHIVPNQGTRASTLPKGRILM